MKSTISRILKRSFAKRYRPISITPITTTELLEFTLRQAKAESNLALSLARGAVVKVEEETPAVLQLVTQEGAAAQHRVQHRVQAQAQVAVEAVDSKTSRTVD